MSVLEAETFEIWKVCYRQTSCKRTFLMFQGHNFLNLSLAK